MARTSLQDSRRPADDVTVRNELIARFHLLQERQIYHQAWLRIESPRAADQYARLIEAVHRAASTSLSDAWATPGISIDEDLNVGPLPIDDVSTEQEEFERAVARDLQLIRGWPW